MDPDLGSYDAIIVAFSGGKDSLACALRLLELGVPREKIELWHHDVDGREGSTLMDWPVTRDYCRRVAATLELPLYFSWKEGGFEREMNRRDTPTAPTHWEGPGGFIGTAGGAGPKNTREKFPQVSADLSVRWCSAYLKIDVCAAAVRNQSRFRNHKTLVVSGERAQESAARAKYKTFEPDRSDARDGRTGRHVDRWRPVHAWPEEEVWAIIRRWGIVPHPAYRIGWGRVSCMSCIFGSPNQWASVRAIAPGAFETIAAYEGRWGKTIQRNRSVRQLADAGTAYSSDASLRALALAMVHDAPVRVSPEDWVLPQGAFGESCGPT